MVKFRFTKKAQKKLGVIKSDELIETERFMTWHVNDFKDSRRTGLIFMNDLTRFSVIIFGLRKSDLDRIDELFKHQLEMNLIRLGVDELRIRRYMKTFDSVAIDDSSDRSVLGSITDYLKMLPYWIEGEDTEDSEFISYLNDKFNGTPVLPLERDGFEPFPDKAMLKVLNSK
jgi:hypothetical protein